ncbi:CFC_HP_G0008460.mRNA.1.CDS.1 [Saccharomyces cerevisiae]|nr:CFC_HP_G0008460.mRNA.1.CDS.1 [Saccharomyces cerevisiae]CAI6925431.1 CFC_HP_G0008460.mRNA.1.CDS.1 [Saccharomyces cerevisiae]
MTAAKGKYLHKKETQKKKGYQKITRQHPETETAEGKWQNFWDPPHKSLILNLKYNPRQRRCKLRAKSLRLLFSRKKYNLVSNNFRRLKLPKKTDSLK